MYGWQSSLHTIQLTTPMKKLINVHIVANRNLPYSDTSGLWMNAPDKVHYYHYFYMEYTTMLFHYCQSFPPPKCYFGHYRMKIVLPATSSIKYKLNGLNSSIKYKSYKITMKYLLWNTNHNTTGTMKYKSQAYRYYEIQIIQLLILWNTNHKPTGTMKYKSQAYRYYWYIFVYESQHLDKLQQALNLTLVVITETFSLVAYVDLIHTITAVCLHQRGIFFDMCTLKQSQTAQAVPYYIDRLLMAYGLIKCH